MKRIAIFLLLCMVAGIVGAATPRPKKTTRKRATPRRAVKVAPKPVKLTQHDADPFHACEDTCSHVHGIEIVKDAVTDANRNAVINGIVNATYTCGKAEELIPQWAAAGQGPWEGSASAGADIAILDPPRAGCRPQLLEAIAEASIPAVIYVSCDPATLARDVKLLHEKGYELVEATPVDMFPNAGHVETVALIQRRKNG